MSTPAGQYIATSADDLASDTAGDKAVRLQAALRGGLPVPDWFVILPEAFFSGMNRSQHAEFATSREPAKIKFLAQRLQLGPRFVDELADAINTLVSGDPDAYLAIRSSPVEDGDGDHIAPALYVRPDDARAKIVDVWRAAYAEDVLFRRAECRPGVPLAGRPPAVIVQIMVRSDVSGVVYGGDPATGRRGTALIEAVYGLGTTMQAGVDESDKYEVSRDGRIERREIVPKRTAHVFEQIDACGVASLSVPVSRQRLAALSDSQVQTVADLVWRANSLFQRPQELYWSFEAGHIFVLQTGPVPALDRLADPDGAPIAWDRRGVAALFPGIVTPLTFSVARWMLTGSCRALARELGVDDAVIRARADLFDNTIGVIDGHIYRNATRLRELLSILPQPDWHKHQLAVSLGLIENQQGSSDFDADDADEILHLDALGTGRMLARLKLQESRCEATRRDFEPRLRGVTDASGEPLDRLRPDELTSRIRRIQVDVIDAWDAPSANEALAAIALDLLRQLSLHWLDDDDGRIAEAIVWNVEDLPGTHAAAGIIGMARSVARLPSVQSVLTDGGAAAIDAAMSADSSLPLRNALEAHLDRFGRVSPDGLKIEAAPLCENPMPLLREIGGLSRRLDTGDSAAPSPRLLPTRSVTAEDVRAAAAAEERAESLLSTHTWRRMFFHNVLSIARRRIRDRELYGLDRSHVVGELRRLLLELGRRFYALDVIDAPRHILYLDLSEVLGFVEGASTTTDLRGLVGVRWQDHSRQGRRSANPPSELATSGVVYVGRDIEDGGAS